MVTHSTEAKPHARLVLRQPDGQEQTFELGAGQVNLGRATTNDIVLNDARASRNHAQLQYGPGGFSLVDLGSSNGTRVNGVAVQQANLSQGDVISVGDCELRFEIRPPELEPEPELTLIQSEADLEMTLAHATLSTRLTDTQTPRLAIHMPGRTWEVPFEGDVLTIGRNPDNDVILDHPRASRKHARIERSGDSLVLRDLNSTNGTWIGQRQIEQHMLEDGDTIRIGDAQLVFKSGFAPDDLTLVETPALQDDAPRRPVVIVPGLLGSELWRGSERLWPNARLLFTQPEMFRMPAEDVFEPRGIVREVVIVPNLLKLEQYSRLGDYLEEGLGYVRDKDLFEFAYDWRQDVRESARHLARAIEEWGIAPPVTLIAHSLGCLVSRYYVERVGGRHKVGRVIFLGGPHYGVPEAINSLLVGPNLLPFGLFGERFRRVIGSFPSMYQILPTYACVVDQTGQEFNVLEDETWLPEEHRPLLRAAREFRRELGTHCRVPSVSIFGYNLKTKNKIIVHRNATGSSSRLEFATEPNGDSTIPETSTILEGSEIHPVQQDHGSLYVDNDVKRRLKLELTR